jgi:ADP-ribosylglycohydrolase
MADLSLRLPIEDPVDHETPVSESPVVRSALWAAWGDALGFPVELAREPRELQNRFGAEEVREPVAWQRRIGGRFGPDVKLPAGAYSDDTQLRLAVSRCIRSGGRFDVEAFSKVELPIFLTYEFGAGRATRRAAQGLTKRATRWNSNFFEDRVARYVSAGGNGAAMRIQPHVWAARNHRAEAYLPSLLRDAVCTHGHPRGILGAAWHALALGAALRDRHVSPPRTWLEMAKSLGHIPSRMEADDALRERWLPRWSQIVGEPFVDVCRRTVAECEELANTAIRAATKDGDLAERYADLASNVGALRAETRGSGTVSAILALWVAWVGQDHPLDALRAASNLRSSDTDTIATMAGAILGAVAESAPPGELQDRAVHIRQAGRLDDVRDGRPVENFPHPDLLHWQAPPTLSDAVGLDDTGRTAIAGLGAAEPIGEPFSGRGKEAVVWQWLRLQSGQTVLAKRRTELVRLERAALPVTRASAETPAEGRMKETEAPQRVAEGNSKHSFPATVEDALAAAIDHDFDEQSVGRLILHLGQQEYGDEKAGIFAALVVRAQREQQQGSHAPPHIYRTNGRR